MDRNQADADFPFAEMLRTWEPPDQVTLERFERKAEALRNASNIAHLAVAPAALAVLVPLFNLRAPWEDLLAGAAWATAIAMFGITAYALVRAKRMTVSLPRKR